MGSTACVFCDCSEPAARPVWRARVGRQLLPGRWTSRDAARAGVDEFLRGRGRRARFGRLALRLRLPGWRLRRLRAAYLDGAVMRERLNDALVGAESAGERQLIADEIDGLWAAFGQALFGRGGVK